MIFLSGKKRCRSVTVIMETYTLHFSHVKDACDNGNVGITIYFLLLLTIFIRKMDGETYLEVYL